MKQKILMLIMSLCVICSQTYAASVHTPFKITEVEHKTTANAFFLPITETCEALGSLVYTSENGYMIITRDGDVAEYTDGSNEFTLNGNTYILGAISEEPGYVSAVFMENLYGIRITSEQIFKDMVTNPGNIFVADVMKFCFNDNFYPENFSRYLKYHIENPGLYMGAVINNVNIGLDKKWHADAVFVDNPTDKLALINKMSRLPVGYAAPELSSVNSYYASGGGYMMNTEAYYKFVDMFDAAYAEGLRLKIVSAYRTEDYQRNLYNSYVRKNGAAYAAKYSAQPGYSEHQTGFAIDINSVYTTFERSREYKWLKENAHKYGFIERYKKGAENITGYAYEPWHYRYVGIDAATTIYNEGITYEEYYSKYVYKSKYSADNDRIWADVIRYYYN